MSTSDEQEPASPLPGDAMPDGKMPPRDWEHRETFRAAVEQTLKVSARLNRRALAAALAPVVWGAMRRAFSNVFKQAVVSLNRFLVLTFSADGLRWHFEALRTGRTFADVVREHSLVEPVTQVFLIHRRTGLLLAQMMQPEVAEQQRDGDMVSGMLTVVQDFVRDSFNVKAEDMLEVIRVGDMSVLIEQGPHAILAGILSQGYEPKVLRETFRRSLKQIHTEFSSELEHFGGDVAPFEPASVILERCLKESMVKGDERISPLTGIVLALPVLAILVLGGLFVESSLRWRAYVNALQQEPGIVVLDTGWKGGLRTIHGMRDPLATDPGVLLHAFGINSGDLHVKWESYQSLDDVILVERVRRTLEVPPSVNVSINMGSVVLDGVVPPGWKVLAQSRFGALEGIRSLRMNAVHEEGATMQSAWERYVSRLKQTPGIVVLDAQWREGRFYLRGMRDPLARDPDVLLGDEGLADAPVTQQWAVYQDLHPQLVADRAERSLAAPESVHLELKDGILKLSGRASNAWIREASLKASVLPGIIRIDKSDLEDADLSALHELIPVIEEPIFYYLADRQNMWPGQERKFNTFLDAVQRFDQLSRRIGKAYVIEIRGHAPASGDADVARQASLAIADRFYARLQQSNVNIERFVRSGVGGDAAESAKSENARQREAHISFRVRAAE